MIETVGVILLIIACVVQFTLWDSQSRRSYAWRVTIITCLLPVWTVMDFGWPLLIVNVILVGLTVALWLPEILLWRSERQVKSGCCCHCGYNLTGNVTGRCPECGGGDDRLRIG